MKIITIILCIIWLADLKGLAQEKKNNLCFGLNFTHYVSNRKERCEKFIPVSPGCEILYKYHVNDKAAISSGINYSFTRWVQNCSSSSFRRTGQEFAFPLLAERICGSNISITVGTYAGWLISGKEENLNKFITDWIDITEHSNYDESSKFTWDLYFDVGYLLNENPKHQVVIAPFVKYKLKDNWMGEERTKTSLGLTFKF